MVKAACERPDDGDRSLCQWDCLELARHLVAEGLVDGISRETVRRILSHHQLKPWRYHLWLSPTVPRDARFAAVHGGVELTQAQRDSVIDVW